MILSKYVSLSQRVTSSLNKHDCLFENLNNYHEKIKFEVYCKANIFRGHWKSQIPKWYKRNAITWDLYHSRRISPNFYHEKNEIRSKLSSAGYLMRFVNSVINDFERKEHDPMIPKYLFNDSESKSIDLIDIPFYNENEKVSKQLLKKLKVLTK